MTIPLMLSGTHILAVLLACFPLTLRYGKRRFFTRLSPVNV